MKYYHEYTDLLDKFLVLQKSLYKEKIASFNNLIEEYHLWYSDFLKSNRRNASNFNPLYLFNLKFDELTHSNILAWIFDPYETHSQGDLFFKHFLEHFSFDIEYSSWNYKVKREYCGNESIIDILVYSSEFIFYIENKTLSAEGVDQTNREYRDLIKFSEILRINKNIFPIYLSPSGNQPENPNWIPISYSSLATALERSLVEIQASYVRYFLESWLSVLRSIKED